MRPTPGLQKNLVQTRNSLGLGNRDTKTAKAALALANAMPMTTRQQKRPSLYFKKSSKNANDSFFEEEEGQQYDSDTQKKP
jgi:hypothetical protein